MASSAEELLLRISGDATGGQKAVDDITAAVDKTVKSLSGDGLFGAANNTTAAIQQLGGVTKLTAAEQDRATATIDKAIEKYRVLGQTAPQSILDLSAALKSAHPPVEALGKDADDLKERLKNAFENPVGAAKSFASSMVGDVVPAMGSVGVAVGAAVTVVGLASVELMHVGSEAEAVGAKIGRMGSQFNTPVQNVSDLRFAVNAAGGDFDTFGDSMFTFQKRIEDNGDAVDKGLKKIGLSVESIKQMRPDEQFLAISDAVRASGSEVNKSAVAFEIFGKQGKEILPLLMKPLSDLTDESEKLGNTWNDRDVAAARAFRSEVTKLGAETEEAWTVLGRTVAPITNEITIGGDRMKLAIANVIVTVATSGDTLLNFVGLSKDWALASETAAAKQDVINKAISEGAPATIRYGEALRFVNEQFALGRPEQDRAAESAQEWLKKLGDSELAASKATAADELLTKGLAEQGVVRGGVVDLTDRGTEAEKKFQSAVDGVKASLEGDTRNIRAEVVALDQLIAGGIRDEDVKNRAIDLITKLEDKHITLTARIYEWDTANRQVLGTSRDFSGVLTTQLGLTSGSSESMHNLASTTNEFHDGISIAGDTVATVTIPTFSALVNGPLPQMKQKIDDATEATLSLSDALDVTLGAALDKLPHDIASALLHGQGIDQAMKAFGVQMGDAFIKGFQAQVKSGMSDIGLGQPDSAGGKAGMGAAVLGAGLLANATQPDDTQGRGGAALHDAAVGAQYGAIAGPVGMAIGAGIGAMIGALKVPAIELAGRKVEADFEGQFGSFQKMMDAVGDAYIATGRTSQQAQSDVKALMGAEKQGGDAVKTMIDKINGVFADQKQKAADVSTAVDSILSTAQSVGVNFPDAMKPLVTQLAALPGLTDDERKSLLGLTDAVKPNFADLTSTAKDYGLSLTDLGPAFEQADITGRADKILKDFDNLDKAGANSDAVLHGMGKSINTLINDALKYGSTLPTALKPLAEQLAITGQLTDDAGNKITDVSKLKFDDAGDPLAKGMDSLTTALNRLGDLLDPNSPKGIAAKTQSTAAAMAASLASVPDKHINVFYDRQGDGGPDWGGPQAAGGSFRVTRPTLFLAGEAGDEDVAFSGGGKSFRGAGAGVVVNVTVEGNVSTERDLADALQGHIMDRLRGQTQLNLRGQ